jgi:formylglycine-generating enzyme
VRHWRTLAPALLLLACGNEALPPAGQIVLFVDTDAPLPQAPGSSPDPDAPPPLFDRLRIDVLRLDAEPGEPPLARRDFPLHRGLFATGPVSVGIVPPVGRGGFAARARIYRSADIRSGEPAESSSIDATRVLPAVATDGVLNVPLTLNVADTAQPRVLDEPAAAPEIPKNSAVGSWASAARVPCPEAPAEDEACVPGGAFWMGDPELRDDTEVADAEREHLVVVSPFFIDTHEVTVGELRAHAAELRRAGAPLPPTWSGSVSGLSDDDYSTYTSGPSSNDPADVQSALPVNGVVWQTAQAYCQALGKELPSEAMYEFLASGRGLEHRFVWGNDEPTCDDAVSGRAGFGVYVTFDGACRPPESIGGPLPLGAGQRDKLELGGRDVVDLAGNLSEWTQDFFNTEDEGVWATPGVLVDPVAREPGASREHRTARGGSWRSRYVELRAAARLARDPASSNRSLGFRCARRP